MINHRNIAVITHDTSDLLELMQRWGPAIAVMKPEDITNANWDQIDVIAILGGNAEKPLLFKANERMILEEQLQLGKKMFAEYVASIGHVYAEPPSSTRYLRLAFCADDVEVRGLTAG